MSLLETPHPFEVDRKPSLQLIGTHLKYFEPLIIVDVWVMVFVQYREAVVSSDAHLASRFPYPPTIGGS